MIRKLRSRQFSIISGGAEKVCFCFSEQDAVVASLEVNKSSDCHKFCCDGAHNPMSYHWRLFGISDLYNNNAAFCTKFINDEDKSILLAGWDRSLPQTRY